MAEDYKVLIGAEPNESEFQAIENRIKKITDKEHPIKFTVDEKVNSQLNSLKDALNNFANGIDLFKGIDINKQARRLGIDVNNSLKKSLNVDDVIGNAYKKLLKIENKAASPIRKNRLDSIAPILKDNIGLLENFNNAMNNTTNLSDWNNVLGVVQNIQDGIINAGDSLKHFQDALNQKYKIDIEVPKFFEGSLDDTKIKAARTIKRYMESQSFDISNEKTKSFYNWISNFGTAIDKSVFKIENGYQAFQAVLRGFSEQFSEVINYNPTLDLDTLHFFPDNDWDIDKYLENSIKSLDKIINARRRLKKESDEEAFGLKNLRETLSSKFNIDDSGIMTVTLQQLEQIVDVCPVAQRYIDQIKNSLSQTPKIDIAENIEDLVPEDEIKKAKFSLEDLQELLLNMKNVFATLGNENILDKLLGSILQMPAGFQGVSEGLRQIRATVPDIIGMIDGVTDSISKLQTAVNQKDLRLDFGLDERLTAGERNALYDQEALDVIPEMRKQADELLSLLGVDAPQQLGNYIREHVGGNFYQELQTIQNLSHIADKVTTDSGKLVDSKTQVKNIRAYIQKLREYANLGNINLSKFDEQFAPLEDALRRLDDISSGKMERNALDERLKEIFGSDSKAIETSLERISHAFNSFHELLSKFGQGDPQAFTGITEELQKISEEFGKIKSGLESLNKSFETFNGDTKFQDLVSSLNSLPHSIAQLNDLSTSISKLADSISVLQQDCDRINQTLTTGTRIAQNAGNSYSQIGDAARQVGNIIDQVDAGQVSADKGFLRGLGLDSASIDVITRDLNSVITQVKEVKQVFNKDGQLKLEVKGLDTNGREVSITRGYKWGKTESGDEILEPYGKLSVKEKFVTEAEEVEEAYNKMQEHLKKMDTLAKSEARADDDFSIDYFHKQYEKEAEEYSKLVAKYWDKFSNEQKIDLINKNRKTKNDVKLIDDQKAKKQADEIEKQNKEAEKLLEDAEKKIRNKAEEIADIEIEIDKLKINEGSIAEIERLTEQLEKLREEYRLLNLDLSSAQSDENIALPDDVQKRIEEGKAYNRKVYEEGIAGQAEKISLDFTNRDFEADLESVKANLNKLSNATDETRQSVVALENAYKALDNAINIGDNSQIIKAKEVYDQAKNTANNAIRANKILDDQIKAQQKAKNDAAKLDASKHAFESGMDVWLSRNSEAADHFADEIAHIRQRLKECDATELSKLKVEFTDLKRRAELAGKTVKSFGDRLQDQFKAFGTYFALDNIIDEAIQGIRDMYDQVVQIDSAMTDLYKVTDETPERYSQFLKSSQDGAKELGRSVSSYITQSAKWAQMGYGIDQSEQLAKVSSIYANVADVTDEVAVSDIVSNLKAFGIEAENAISVVDVLNNLSNKYAVTAAGLGQGLTNSASAMAMSNATFEQTTALLTGIAEITQSPSEAGSFLKVASMRIRGMKGELEELGEEVDSNVDSISKVQTQILNLTGGKVNIFDGNDEFRNYYEIMEDIAKVYNDLSSTEQSNLTEILFGKMRGNQGAAMIQAFQSGQIQKALKDAMTSEGSAYAEQEKWADSLEARIGKISASWQSLSETILKSDFLKFLMDGLIGFMNGLEGVLDTAGTLPTILASIAGALSFKDVGELMKQFHYSITLENEYAHKAT